MILQKCTDTEREQGLVAVIDVMEKALQQIASSHPERVGYDQTDIDEIPDLSGEEAMKIARETLEDAAQLPAVNSYASSQAEIARLKACLRRIAEGNLGDDPWQANYEKIRAVAATALSEALP